MVKAEPFESLVSGDARLQELGLQAGDRAASARTIEEVGKAKPELLPLLLRPLQPLLGDESPAVVKRAMQTLTALYRPALALLAQQRGPVPPELLEMSELLGELKAQMLSALEMSAEMSASDAVRTNALKFAVSLVLAFCSQEAGRGARAAQGGGAARGGRGAAAAAAAPAAAAALLHGAHGAHERTRRPRQAAAAPAARGRACAVRAAAARECGGGGGAAARAAGQRADLAQIGAPRTRQAARRTSPRRGGGVAPLTLTTDPDPDPNPDPYPDPNPNPNPSPNPDPHPKQVEASLLVSLHALGAASQAELHLRQQGREMPSTEQLAATAAPLMQQAAAAAAAPSGGKRAADAPAEPDSKRQRAGESAGGASGAGHGGGGGGGGMHLEKNAGASMPLTRLPAAQIAQLQQMLSMLAPEMVAEL
eukprot:scaffold65578_cov66-Phaeocystis_antarctica.AAC.3